MAGSLAVAKARRTAGLSKGARVVLKEKAEKPRPGLCLREMEASASTCGTAWGGTPSIS